MERQVILYRKELHALVWTEPLSRLAKRYGLTDYGLRKVCINMGIPLPRGDHWNKARVGNAEPAPVLSGNYRGPLSVTLQIVESAVEEVDGEYNEPMVSAVRSFLLKKMKEQWGIMDGLVKCDDKYLDVRVAPPTIDRACGFMDRLLGAFKERRFEIEIKEGKTLVIVNGEALQLVCREKRKRVSKESQYSWDRTELQASGVLVLQVIESYRTREWVEGKQALTTQIPTILDKLEQLGREITARKREWAEYQEIAAAEEKARKELEKRREKELADFKLLLNEAARWRRANLIREYVAAAVPTGHEVSPGAQEWAEWALKKADWYDPRMEAPDEWLVQVDRTTLAFSRSVLPSQYLFHEKEGEDPSGDEG